MNIYHQEISTSLAEYIEEHHLAYDTDAIRYLGTSKAYCYIRAPELRKIYRNFSGRHPELSKADFETLLESLSVSRDFNEFCAIGLLLEAYPHLRQELDPFCIDHWLENAEGWAEVDVICQFNFTAQEMLAKWPTWEALLAAFVVDENIHKRRASLVLLTKPLRESNDPRLAHAAFTNIDRLRGERAVLITKAVSWALRALIKNHRTEVETYLEANAALLPKIALREVGNKLDSGVKGKRTMDAAN